MNPLNIGDNEVAWVRCVRYLAFGAASAAVVWLAAAVPSMDFPGRSDAAIVAVAVAVLAGIDKFLRARK